MSEATRITAVRHGETAWNREQRIQGALDIALNATGQQQAQRLAQALKDETIDAIYSSDLLRAWDTARALSEASGVALHTDVGLRERAFGRFEGRTFSEIERDWPDQALRWRKREPQWAPLGGESLIALRLRVLDTVTALARAHPGRHLVLVSHGGVLDVLYRAATGLDLQAARTWALGNATINRLLWTPQGFSLIGWADDQHLLNPSNDEAHA